MMMIAQDIIRVWVYRKQMISYTYTQVCVMNDMNDYLCECLCMGVCEFENASDKI